MIKKLKYIFTHQMYHPYFGYWFDLLTERKLKYRTGECVDCVECCRYSCGCLCSHVNPITKRCIIYDKRTCDVWFPISQKEIDYMAKVKPGFKCRFKFEK